MKAKKVNKKSPKIPKLSKKVKSYALNEDGKISKQALISMGAFLGTSALAGVLKSKNAASHGNFHRNSLSVKISVDDIASGQHTHHASY
jgi:hypothetical protein